ncbi:MAG: hypothetical protein KDA86_21945 [Planctomycetaceae bacterium]|nr:hypothetical protein [Planctomycetaceae bacterium]MCA9108804.1 hypothetical protein [Planctomycetaceae bacterium]
MQTLFLLWNDEAGFIVSAELVIVATLLVVGLIVGLSEVQHAVVSELNDVGDAIGSLNQGYRFSGFSKRKNNGGGGGVAARSYGSAFTDTQDACDNNQCDIDCDRPQMEAMKGMGGGAD